MSSNGRCGRCGRYIATRIENIALFFPGILTDRGPFNAALNAFVAEDHLLGGRGDQTRCCVSFKKRFYTHLAQDSRTSCNRPPP